MFFILCKKTPLNLINGYIILLIFYVKIYLKFKLSKSEPADFSPGEKSAGFDAYQ